MSGRTRWWTKDASWHIRERAVVLGSELGGEALAALDWLEAQAAAQLDGGRVRSGYAALMHGAFLSSPAAARRIVARAVEIGWLDDFVERDGGGGFDCRVSGWTADQERGRAAGRKQAQREKGRDMPNVREPSKRRPVTNRDKTGQTVTNRDSSREVKREGEETTDSSHSPNPARQVFEAWIEATGRTQRTRFSPQRRRRITLALEAYPLDEVLDAVRGWRNSPHHRGDNRDGTVYNELTLLLRSPEHVEKFRDLQRGGGRRGQPTGRDADDVLREAREAGDL